MTIRVGRNTDLPAIGRLWEQLLRFHVRRDARFETAPNAREAFLRYVSASVLRSPDHTLFVAEVDGEVGGFMIARVEYGGPIFRNPDFGYITDACVDEAYRRLGVGRKLFDAARAWLAARGMTNIRVSVASENPVAQAFWRDLGFRPFMERLWYDVES